MLLNKIQYDNDFKDEKRARQKGTEGDRREAKEIRPARCCCNGWPILSGDFLCHHAKAVRTIAI